MVVTAARLGLGSCDSCGAVACLPRWHSRALQVASCLRCGARLQRRPPRNLRQTAAPLLAAALLFGPANLLPVMTTTTLVRQHSDTVLTGVMALWQAGSWGLATLVFTASILVPAVKIAALTLLVVTTWRRSSWRRRERARLYRLLEYVGRWSMLDVFVMALLAALVRSRMAGVHIEAGALLFGAVVVLTMVASSRFDPRLIWATAPADIPREGRT